MMPTQLSSWLRSHPDHHSWASVGKFDKKALRARFATRPARLAG